MGLLDFVEQNDRIGLSPHGFGELTPLIKTHITRRGSYELGHRMSLHVFGHIDANHVLLVVKEKLCECACKLRLAYARRPEKNEASYGTVRILDACTSTDYGVGYRPDRLILTNNPAVKMLFQVHELLHFSLHQS